MKSLLLLVLPFVFAAADAEAQPVSITLQLDDRTEVEIRGGSIGTEIDLPGLLAEHAIITEYDLPAFQGAAGAPLRSGSLGTEKDLPTFHEFPSTGQHRGSSLGTELNLPTLHDGGVPPASQARGGSLGTEKGLPGRQAKGVDWVKVSLRSIREDAFHQVHVLGLAVEDSVMVLELHTIEFEDGTQQEMILVPAPDSPARIIIEDLIVG